MDVSENSGTPKSSILIGFSIINHPFWGYPPSFGNTHILKPSRRHFHPWALTRLANGDPDHMHRTISRCPTLDFSKKKALSKESPEFMRSIIKIKISDFHPKRYMWLLDFYIKVLVIVTFFVQESNSYMGFFVPKNNSWVGAPAHACSLLTIYSCRTTFYPRSEVQSLQYLSSGARPSFCGLRNAWRIDHPRTLFLYVVIGSPPHL